MLKLSYSFVVCHLSAHNPAPHTQYVNTYLHYDPHIFPKAAAHIRYISSDYVPSTWTLEPRIEQTANDNNNIIITSNDYYICIIYIYTYYQSVGWGVWPTLQEDLGSVAGLWAGCATGSSLLLTLLILFVIIILISISIISIINLINHVIIIIIIIIIAQLAGLGLATQLAPQSAPDTWCIIYNIIQTLYMHI